ncbi:MAG: leucine zipper domain-containing protein [Thermoleophilia bacterium]
MTSEATTPAPITIPSADDPAAALAAVVALRRLADRLERAAVDRAVEQGWTWAQVAEALGVTRQAAHKRHAGRARRRDEAGGRAR